MISLPMSDNTSGFHASIAACREVVSADEIAMLADADLTDLNEDVEDQKIALTVLRTEVGALTKSRKEALAAFQRKHNISDGDMESALNWTKAKAALEAAESKQNTAIEGEDDDESNEAAVREAKANVTNCEATCRGLHAHRAISQ